MKKIIGFLVALVMLISLPINTSAYFTDADVMEELRSQITSLLAQVKQLQAQLATLKPTNTACYTFNANLGVGNSGEDVKSLRSALAQSGTKVIGEGREDLFDEFVASAVSAFQEKYRSEILTPAGLSNSTGYVGARTRAKLNQLYGCATGNGIDPVFSNSNALNLNQVLSNTEKIKVYLIDPNVPNNNGPTGCGDNVVAIEKPLLDQNSPLKAALTQLISYKTGDGSGLYNAFTTDNLSLSGVSILNGEATINLSGSHNGAVCDTPRIKAQLEKTALQFSNVNKVSIFINGIPFEKATSGQGSAATINSAPIISKIYGPLNSSYQYGTEGEIIPGKVASMYGKGLIGNIIIKIFHANQSSGGYEISQYLDGHDGLEDKIYDTHLEFDVPYDLAPGIAYVTVTNESGKASNAYKVNIEKPSVAITSFSQTSGSVGTVVSVIGSGFTSANKVVFGNSAISTTGTSLDGKILQFTIPASANPCQPGQICGAPSTFYKVFITNTNGVSDSIDFTVYAQ